MSDAPVNPPAAARIAGAAEDAAEAEIIQAEAAEVNADANLTQANATAAAVNVATADSAVALASTTAAAATQQAAATITENEEQLAWLRQHATQTESSLGALAASLSNQQQETQSMKTMLTGLVQGLQSLTPRQAPRNLDGSPIDPALASEAGQPGAGSPPAPRKHKRNII